MSQYISVVTGGASGIGRSLCLSLARRQSTVFIADINEEAARIVAAEIRQSGGTAFEIKVDVSKRADVERLITYVLKTSGRIDYFINSAGIHLLGEVRDMSPDLWQKMIDVNLMGTIHGTQLAYNAMIQQRHGHIINISSISGLYPAAYEVAYATTKYAIVGLSTSLREEARDLGIKLSVVCPSLVRTGIIKTGMLLNLKREKIENHPMVKNAKSADVAANVILRGIDKNKAIIPVNLDATVIWHLYRWFPNITAALNRIVVNSHRKNRQEYLDHLNRGS